MSFYKQEIDCTYIDRGEWELFAAIVDGHFNVDEEDVCVTLPVLFARRLMQEIQHMQAVWANPATVSRLIKEGIEASRSAHSELEVTQ